MTAIHQKRGDEQKKILSDQYKYSSSMIILCRKLDWEMIWTQVVPSEMKSSLVVFR